MSKQVPAIPAGYHAITPYLIVSRAASAIEFYKKAFGAVELMRMDGPGGTIAHAELKVGDSPFMLADQTPEFKAPESLGGSPVSILLYVDDVDSTFEHARRAGARELRPLADQFYGDRTATIADPFGHTWTIATHKEDVSPEEMQRRMEQMTGSQK